MLDLDKAQKLVDLSVDHLVQFIEMVKSDEIVPTLTQEFFDRADNSAE